MKVRSYSKVSFSRLSWNSSAISLSVNMHWNNWLLPSIEFAHQFETIDLRVNKISAFFFKDDNFETNDKVSCWVSSVFVFLNLWRVWHMDGRYFIVSICFLCWIKKKLHCFCIFKVFFTFHVQFQSLLCHIWKFNSFFGILHIIQPFYHLNITTNLDTEHFETMYIFILVYL